MIKNPYNSKIQTFTPLKMRGMSTNAFLTENRKSLEKELEGNKPEIIPYKVGAVSFNMIRGPKLAFEIQAYVGVQMGQTAVTQELFQAVMGFNPSYSKGSQKKRYPVEEVTWFDCISFCNKLSELLGLQPCYRMTGIENYKEATRVNSILSAKVSVNGSANGFRLPTDAEWVSFAKAGTNNEWSGTNIEGELGRYAWSGKNSGGTTHSVGGLKPNEWGLYDMSGNVSEWCWDKIDFDDEDPSPYRIFRGGNWGQREIPPISATPESLAPSTSDIGIGFRICRKDN